MNIHITRALRMPGKMDDFNASIPKDGFSLVNSLGFKSHLFKLKVEWEMT